MKVKMLMVLLVAHCSFAQQRSCGLDQYMKNKKYTEKEKIDNLNLKNQFEKELKRLRTSSSLSKTTSNTVINIPVAVHFPAIVATTANADLRFFLIQRAIKQIEILNEDFNSRNADISKWQTVKSQYSPTEEGSLNVHFQLATLNHPVGSGLGFPRNGDVAVTFGTDFLNENTQAQPGYPGEDSTWAGYLNILVIDYHTLGSAMLGMVPNNGATIFIDQQAFGAETSTAPYQDKFEDFKLFDSYDLGRTVTHEIGHYLNLDHTFSATCDTSVCSTSGDSVCDTPSADQPAWALPDQTQNNSCGVKQLVMNYMDYNYDEYTFMYTQGQTERMRAHLNVIASQFKTSALDANITYCNPSQQPNNYDAYSYIKQVTLINTNSTGTGTTVNTYPVTNTVTNTTYTKVTNPNTVTLYSSKDNFLKVKVAANGDRNAFIYAYIDYNHNGSFEDTELISMGNISFKGDNKKSVKDNIPVTFISSAFTFSDYAYSGTTRMRIIYQRFKLPRTGIPMWTKNQIDKCKLMENSDANKKGYGNIQDFDVNLISTGGSVTPPVSKSEIEIKDQEFATQDQEVENFANLSIYPNPVSGDNMNITLIQDETPYTIYNYSGQEVKSGTVTSKTINVSNLSKGNYLLHLQINDQRIIKQFIKQ
jgi:Pregnancy-associated plasma protein-A/Secretion system C-terminal sorting domain/GEVED domain